MLNVERLKSFRFGMMRGTIPALCLLVLGTLVPFASSQVGTSEFTLQISPLTPNAIAPGGTTSAAIEVTAANGYTGNVAFTCQVTATVATTDTPACIVSPTTVTPTGSATLTITSKFTTTTTLYNITLTASGATTTYTTSALQLTVLAVSAQFTISIQTPVAPGSVVAGSGAQGVISVSPANGYTGTVTLTCASITPLVTIPPICSFAPPSLPVPGPTSTLTISTFGPITTGSRTVPRSFYALWSLPLLGLVGLGTGRGRTRRAWGLLTIFMISALLLLLPACGNNANTTTSTPNGTTPANSYTFTIVGVDAKGNASSNITSTNAGPTVSLTVTAPK